MTEPKFGKIKTPISCPGTPTGYVSAHKVKTGDFVLFEEARQDLGGGNEHTVRVMGRVLGTCLRTPDGQEHKPRTMLAVLSSNDCMSHGFVRYVRVEDVVFVAGNPPGAFARFFLYGEAPSPGTAVRMSEIGLMDDAHLAEYLEGPAESPRIRDDWRSGVWDRKLAGTGGTE